MHESAFMNEVTEKSRCRSGLPRGNRRDPLQSVQTNHSLFGEENREKTGGGPATLRNTPLCWPRVL